MRKFRAVTLAVLFVVLVAGLAFQEWRLSQEVTNLTARVGTLERRVNSVQSDITGAQSDITSLRGNFDHPNFKQQSLATAWFVVVGLTEFLTDVCRSGYFSYSCGRFRGRFEGIANFP